MHLAFDDYLTGLLPEGKLLHGLLMKDKNLLTYMRCDVLIAVITCISTRTKVPRGHGCHFFYFANTHRTPSGYRTAKPFSHAVI